MISPNTDNIFRELVTPPLTSRKMLLQLKLDFWAKEVQTGYTYTYTWMTNQFGHFGLGFIPTILILCFATDIARMVGVAWLREVALSLVPVLSFGYWIYKENGDVAACAHGCKGLVFAEAFDRRHIWLDALTALLFFGFGIGVAAILAAEAAAGVIAFFVAALFALPVARYWLRRRFYFQQAGIGYVYRLALFPGRFQGGGEEAIMRFWRGQLQHLILVGPEGAGKSSLASAVATELAFDLQLVRKMPLLTLMDYVDSSEPLLQEGHLVWPWRVAKWLIFDDVAVDVPDDGARSRSDEHVSVPTQGRRRMAPDPQTMLDGLLNIQGALREKHTVWTLGAEPQLAQEWIARLRAFLDSEVEVVELQPRLFAQPKG